MARKNNYDWCKLKNFLKEIVLNVPLLRGFFVLIYRGGGKKPWSLGYSVHKFSYIKRIIENRLNIFSQKKLPRNYGFGLDERAVEYPWFFSRLKADELMILDAGSALNHADILSINLLNGRKLYISTLSYEGFPRTDKAPSYVFEDMRKMCYKDKSFDAVVCISTLEHVGMDNSFIYTSDKSKNENDKDSFLKAIHELKRVLKEGGTLYLTMPYGKYKNHKWFQVFDSEMVAQVKEAFSPSVAYETYFKYENRQWNYSDARACQDGYYFDIHNEKKFQQGYLAASQSVVCLELTK